MSEVPSVNTEQKPVPDSEGSDTQWVDPIHAEMHPDRLPDEPEPTPEEVAEAEKVAQADEAAAAETERKANGQYTKAELAALIDELPDDEKPEEGEKKPDGDDAKDGKGEEADDKAAEEAKKKAEEAKGDDDEAEEAKDSKKPRRRSRKRHESRAVRAMERRLQEKDAEIAALKNQPAVEQPAEEAQPKLEDFETADDWAEALGTWTQKQIDAGKEQATRTEEAKREKAVREVIKARIDAYEERADEFRDIHDDYDEVTKDEDLTITPEMAEVIMESELGPQLAYHLGSNPEEAEKIAGLSPLAQAKALARIETRLEAEQAAAEEDDKETPGAEEAEPTEPEPKAAKAPRPSPTKAPEPITTVGGGGASSRRDTSKMSMSEYYEGRLSGKIK